MTEVAARAPRLVADETSNPTKKVTISDTVEVRLIDRTGSPEEDKISLLLQQLGYTPTSEEPYQPTHDDVLCLSQLMGMYRAPVVPYIKMTLPMRLVAKLKGISWLKIAMQETDASINTWDGKGDIPKYSNMREDYSEPFKKFYNNAQAQHNKALQALAEDDPIPELPPAKTSMDWVRFGRYVYNQLRHVMPEGTSREEVHAEVKRLFSRIKGKDNVKEALDSEVKKKHKIKFPSLYDDEAPTDKQPSNASAETTETGTAAESGEKSGGNEAKEGEPPAGAAEETTPSENADSANGKTVVASVITAAESPGKATETALDTTVTTVVATSNAAKADGGGANLAQALGMSLRKRKTAAAVGGGRTTGSKGPRQPKKAPPLPSL